VGRQGREALRFKEEVMRYTSAKDYDEKIKASGKWHKSNDYDVFNFALCLECAYFKPAPVATHGACALMEKEGAYNGVVAQAVCERFISCKGTNINGKQLDPDLLSAIFKIEKMKDGSVFIPRPA
jgi:hypothetical protein